MQALWVYVCTITQTLLAVACACSSIAADAPQQRLDGHTLPAVCQWHQLQVISKADKMALFYIPSIKRKRFLIKKSLYDVSLRKHKIRSI